MNAPKSQLGAGNDRSADFNPSGNYLGVVVAVLFLVNFVNYMDRMVLSVVIEPIRHELGLSDVQIGLLTGFAFAIFYGTAGLGISWLADRYNRKRIIALSLVAWSIMTAVTGAAQSFWHLFLARIGVGVGESGAIPVSHSVIGDYFTPHQRSAVLAIFTSGATLGITAGLTLGGYVAEHWGWRWSFVVAACAGLPVILLVGLVLREPVRGRADGVEAGSAPHLGRVLMRLLRISSYRHLVMVSALSNLSFFGIIQWMPAFLIRKFDLGVAEVGFLFGTALGLGAAGGAIVGGFLANRLVKRNYMWLVWLPLIAAMFAFPLYEMAVFAPTSFMAMALIMTVNIIVGTGYGPTLAATQSVVPPHMRASASAFVGFMASLIGVGGGPFVVGALSEWFQQTRSEADALQLALAIVICSTLFSLVHSAFLVKRFPRDRLTPLSEG